MADTRKIGIVGSGSWAGRYAASLAEADDLELVAVAGGSRAPAYAEKHDLRVAESVEALAGADDVEAVIVATPHGCHAATAVPCPTSDSGCWLRTPTLASWSAP